MQYEVARPVRAAASLAEVKALAAKPHHEFHAWAQLSDFNVLREPMTSA
ncbi:MAG: hypothetical protein NVSMB6_12860 [Burkholderiaceae bacterium]